MKKISKIELENYRAYYDRLEFVLNKGENILLYGENGSGKTSLYKALDCFIQSFYAPVNYTHNRYKPAGALGEVVLSIGDYNPATGLVENARELKLASGVDNTAVEDTKDLKSLADSLRNGTAKVNCPEFDNTKIQQAIASLQSMLDCLFKNKPQTAPCTSWNLSDLSETLLSAINVCAGIHVLHLHC